jgi:ectoine hydroxylase-related dioxygenase (phytanoyl-CoA dioxygenase family)
VQIMGAVSDFTAENGGTLVIPGSHLGDDTRASRPDEAVPTEMKAGSALIRIGSIYHGGWTEHRRRATTSTRSAGSLGNSRA